MVSSAEIRRSPSAQKEVDRFYTFGAKMDNPRFRAMPAFWRPSPGARGAGMFLPDDRTASAVGKADAPGEPALEDAVETRPTSVRCAAPSGPRRGAGARAGGTCPAAPTRTH